ncbi:hypothetical protein [Pleomorphomonas sp. T1.2MG-36]|uniref:hypothetical protein n=1 Tax=Pleomorphomonas sp. T1.2MG-36 TaxID=3041167 RepID=UPI00253FAB83|nr:hypothetical protein [Pleomorphomonas sp. T1.2MG-36]
MINMLERWIVGAAVFAPEGDGMGGDAGAAPESLMFPSEAAPSEAGGDDAGSAPDHDGGRNPPEAKDRAKDGAKDETDAPDPADEIPEDGRYDFNLPEGMAIDEKLAEAMSPVLKDIGLTRGQAQVLAGALAAHRQAEAAHGAHEWADIQTGWVNSARKDAEIGGARWDASVATAQGALARFGTPGLRTFLTESGGGNHPEVIRFMARVGSAIAEDRPESGGAGAGRPREAAHLLFPSDKPKG